MCKTEFSAAKINLNLHILGRLENGYHSLFSLVCFADIGDELSFSPQNEGYSLEVQGQFSQKIEGENIILQAARLAKEMDHRLPFGHFTLHKNLPVASGMGGGSANAAATLRLLRRYSPAPSEKTAQWQELALKLGADVPVCLQGMAVYMSGIGEALEPVGNIDPLFAVLVNPLRAVSTAQVFKNLNAPLIKDETRLEPRLYLEDGMNLITYLQKTRNDLEFPAQHVEPVIKDVLLTLKKQSGCLLSRMSGSGATCFGLFETQEAAKLATSLLTKQCGDWWIRYAVMQ